MGSDLSRWLAPRGKIPRRRIFDVGEPGLELVDDGLDPLGDLGLVVAAEVAPSHLEDDHPGLDPVQLAVVEPPEDVLGLVAADPEVRGLAGGVVLRPCRRRPQPAGGDRVAEEQEVDLPLPWPARPGPRDGASALPAGGSAPSAGFVESALSWPIAGGGQDRDDHQARAIRSSRDMKERSAGPSGRGAHGPTS